MHEAVRTMLDRYHCRTSDEYTHALREILQEMALLGLWRAKFYERAAFYGGTALRVLHGLDRYSEDLDFSLLAPDESFSLGTYGDALKREIEAFGFRVDFVQRSSPRGGAIESAFLKANTFTQLVTISADPRVIEGIHPRATLRVKLEVDTDPPAGFQTESRYLLQPIPFSVRVYTLPDLFAGKLHAVLCRRWKNRVKGRDWYDLVWYVGRGTPVRLSHLESRMRQSGDYTSSEPLAPDRLIVMLRAAVDRLDVALARTEIAPFVRDVRSLDVWSTPFFEQLVEKVTTV